MFVYGYKCPPGLKKPDAFVPADGRDRARRSEAKRKPARATPRERGRFGADSRGPTAFRRRRGGRTISTKHGREHAGATGYDVRTIQDSLPDQQILRRTCPEPYESDIQDDSGGLQGHTRRAQGGRSAGAAFHLIAHGMQWTVRGT